MEEVWGLLYPHSCTFPTLALKQDMFRLGQAGSKWLNAVFKCQCKIARNKTGVFLRDKSSNGIWVNGNKVGKDNIWPLKHNTKHK